jgi:hypothetical protein
LQSPEKHLVFRSPCLALFGLIYIMAWNRYQAIVSVSGLTPEDVSVLLNEFRLAAVKGNGAGKYNFTLDDSYKLYFEVADTDSRWIIFDRTLKSGGSGISAAIDLSKELGKSSREFEFLKQNLQGFNITRQQAEAARDISPAFVTDWLKKRTVQINLTSAPRNRLLEEDLKQALSSHNSGIEFVSADTPGALLLTVGLLQMDAPAPIVQQQTMSVNRWDANFVAMLNMPDYSSYEYDIIVTSVSLAYAFEIKLVDKNKVLIDALVRDKKTVSWQMCSGMRVRNAFGGVAGANFWPNQQVEQACRSPAESSSSDALKAYAIQALALKISSDPSITSKTGNAPTL